MWRGMPARWYLHNGPDLGLSRIGRCYGSSVEPVLAFGLARPGLGAEAAKRGLRLVSPGEPVRAAVHFADDGDIFVPCSGIGVPILQVVRGDDAAVTAAIDGGADDAVAMSASDALIAARLAALVRRTPVALTLGPLEIDRVERLARREGRTLDLLPREYRLLLHLAERAGEIVRHDDLRRAVWGLRFHPGTNVVAVHVSRLRAKLDRGFAEPLLLTEKGLGYRLAVPATAA